MIILLLLLSSLVGLVCIVKRQQRNNARQWLKDQLQPTGYQPGTAGYNAQVLTTIRSWNDTLVASGRAPLTQETMLDLLALVNERGE